MRRVRDMAVALFSGTLATCGGGSNGGSSVLPIPPAFTSVPQVQVSRASTFASGCEGVAATGALYVNTAAEPYLAVNPTSPLNLIGAWQQNRWSDGGAQGLNLAASFDGGRTWTLSNAAFSRCTGGNAANGGNYARATDVWLAVAADGTVYALSLSFTGSIMVNGSYSAMLVARSKDGGLTWGPTTALIQDGASVFNDKGSITADPNDARYVYAVWDRLTGPTAGPSYFAVTADGGTTWQARSIFDPGAKNQTIGNQIAVFPDGSIANVFTELDTAANGDTVARVRAMRSTDHGKTWSAPVTVSDFTAIGTSNPQTGTPVRDGSELVSLSVAPDGVIFVAWQDMRFTGLVDGIAMVQSADHGATWSAPVQVNADHDAQAFTPTIHVRADGVIGVTYYDLRNDKYAPADLWTDSWLVTSSDGVSFKETHLAGPFNLSLAPYSGGLFLGDYESLASTADGFLPFYVQTDVAAQVHSDAFIAFPPASAVPRAALSFRARPVPPGVSLSDAARQRVAERLAQIRTRRHTQPD